MAITDEQFDALRTDVTTLAADLRSTSRAIAEHFETFTRYMDSRFEQVDQRFEQVDQRFERMEFRFDKLENKVDRLDTSLQHLRKVATGMRSEFGDRFEVLSKQMAVGDRFGRNVEDRVTSLEHRVDLLEERG
jgi:septal ring factor EnvC (AmiA/AmiB activator)